MTWLVNNKNIKYYLNRYGLSLLKGIWSGIKIGLSILGGISCFNTFIKCDFLSSVTILLIVFPLSLIIGCIIKRPKNHFDYKLNGEDIRIGVKIGDITESESFIIPINNKFDVSQACIKTSKSVLHSTIDNLFGGDEKPLKLLIKEQVKIGKEHPLGNIVSINIRNKNIYLLSNTKINSEGRSFSEIEDLGEFLPKIFVNIRPIVDKNKELSIPVINTGHGGISNITREDIIKEIIDNFINVSKEKFVCNKLTIYLLEEDIKNYEINFDKLEDYVKHQVTHYKKIDWKSFPKNGSETD